MDSSNSEMPNSVTKDFQENELKKSSNILLSKRSQFYSSYFCQNFSVPNSIIYYILMNPNSAKLYQKLIQSCKYFFIKNPILVISRTNFKYENEWKIEINKKLINLNNVLSKIWITEKIFIEKSDSGKCEIISTLIPKIYKNECKYFKIWHQNISINNFIFLASKCENVILKEITILNDDNSIATLEKIIETLLNAKKFKYRLPEISTNIISTTISEKLIKNPQFLNLDYFQLSNVPITFELESFYNIENKKPSCRFDFEDFSIIS